MASASSDDKTNIFTNFENLFVENYSQIQVYDAEEEAHGGLIKVNDTVNVHGFCDYQVIDETKRVQGDD